MLRQEAQSQRVQGGDSDSPPSCATFRPARALPHSIVPCWSHAVAAARRSLRGFVCFSHPRQEGEEVFSLARTCFPLHRGVSSFVCIRHFERVGPLTPQNHSLGAF